MAGHRVVDVGRGLLVVLQEDRADFHHLPPDALLPPEVFEGPQREQLAAFRVDLHQGQFARFERAQGQHLAGLIAAGPVQPQVD